MSTLTLLLRLLALWALAFWLGGFTFYSAVVIPVLHDQLGTPLETGLITQRVTETLNLLGFATVLLGWLTLLCETWFRQFRPRLVCSTLGSLMATTVCLVVLIALHRVLDRRMDAGIMSGFYSLHRGYLWVSTIQWFCNINLLACWALRGWTVTLEKSSKDFSSS